MTTACQYLRNDVALLFIVALWPWQRIICNCRQTNTSRGTIVSVFCSIQFEQREPHFALSFGKPLLSCCDRKARATSAQGFTLWQQATIETTWRDHSISCSRHLYGVVLRAHSVRGEPRIQRNASGEVATVPALRNDDINAQMNATTSWFNLNSSPVLFWVEFLRFLCKEVRTKYSCLF